MSTELNREEAARLLGVSKRTMEAWAYKHTGPSYQIRGRHAYYKLESLRAWRRVYRLMEMLHG